MKTPMMIFQIIIFVCNWELLRKHWEPSSASSGQVLQSMNIEMIENSKHLYFPLFFLLYCFDYEMYFTFIEFLTYYYCCSSRSVASLKKQRASGSLPMITNKFDFRIVTFAHFSTINASADPYQAIDRSSNVWWKDWVTLVETVHSSDCISHVVQLHRVLKFDLVGIRRWRITYWNWSESC